MLIRIRTSYWNASSMTFLYMCFKVSDYPNFQILFGISRMGVPWIRDADGDLLTKLKMYPLKVVSPLLYLFRVRDKEITEAIEVC